MASSVSSLRRLDQRKRALGRANDVRSGRARLKRELREGRVAIADVLLAPPECAATAPVRDLLEALPRVGPVRAARFLRLAKVSETKSVGALSDRQRARLIELLGGR